MSKSSTAFKTPHNEAFRRLGALEPGQQWSAFDVPRDLARAGKAKLFVTTLWNFHSTKDEKGRRTPTELAIAQDETDGTLWYRMEKPPTGATRKTWIAHWNGIQLALANNIPIVGVLKDVHSKRCSLKHIFDCGNPRYEVGGGVMWLQIKPRSVVGCDVKSINIRQITTQGKKPDLLGRGIRNVQSELKKPNQAPGIPPSADLSGTIRRMVDTARKTVAASNGQKVLRTVKSKNLLFSKNQVFDRYIAKLLRQQGYRCAITGIRLESDDLCKDPELSHSLDRIDSNRGYEAGNLQVVCRFVNRWKSDGADGEFRRLIGLVILSPGEP